MKAVGAKKAERKQNFDEKQARQAKVDGVSLKGDFEHRRSGMAKPKIKRHVSNAEIQIALRPNAQFGLKRKESGPAKTQHPAPKGGPKCPKRGRKRRRKSGAIRMSGFRGKGPRK